MELLEQRIRQDGQILPGGILKVDNFLNHQIDPRLMYEMAQEFKRLFAGEEINKVLTIEASGIAMASMTAYLFSVPLVFAKKSKTRNISDDVYSVEIPSFTHGNTNTVVVSKDYLQRGDRVLIIDDFLATGAALVGLKQLVEMGGGTGGAGRGHRGRRRHRHREGLPGRRRQAARRGHARRIAGKDRLDDRRGRDQLLRLTGRDFPCFRMNTKGNTASVYSAARTARIAGWAALTKSRTTGSSRSRSASAAGSACSLS